MKQGEKRPGARRWAMLAVTVALSLGMLRCTMPTDLGAPQWDVPFTISFNQQRYGLDSLIARPYEFAEDSSGIQAGEDGELVLEAIEEIEPFYVTEEDLTSNNDESVSYDVETDTIRIPLNQTLTESVALDGVLNDMGIEPVPHGFPITIPPGGGQWTFPTTRSELNFDDLDTVRYVRVVGGQIELTIHNDTEIDFDELTVTLRRRTIDGNDYVTLGVLDYNSIEGGESITRTFTFDGDTLTAGLRIVLDGGGSEQTITPDEDDEFRFDLHVGELKADYAEAVIGPQPPVTDQDSVEIDEDIWIKQATVRSGTLDWTVANETDVKTNIVLTFPQVVHLETDDSLSLSFQLDRRGSSVAKWDTSGTLNLADYRLRFRQLPDAAGERQALKTITTVEIIGSGDLPPGDPDYYSEISVGDSVLTTFQVNDITLESVSGVTRYLDYEIATRTQTLELWDDEPDLQQDFGRNISLADVSLRLDVEKTYRLPLRLTIDVLAENTRSGDTANTTLHRDLQGPEQTLNIGGLETLINIAPDRITLSGLAEAGYDVFGVPAEPWDIAIDDSLTGTYRIESPLILSMPNETPLRPSPQKFDSELETDIVSFRLITHSENHVPLGGKLYLMGGEFPDEVSARAGLVRDNFAQYGLTFEAEEDTLPLALDIRPAPVDDNGRATGISYDTLLTRIPKRKIDLFAGVNVWTRQVLVLDPTPQGQDVVAHSTDYINVSVIGEISYRINEQDEE